ncbi:MAG: carbohydrate binding family 9 domain-containing protein [Acidobacteria bacterium]|nr:carbohydrate binding family 9 domain-containing protein [Acidobacteriota bacterium]
MTAARFLTVVLLCVCAGSAAAQVNGQGGPDNGGRRTATAVRLADGESVRLDGRLDEPFWAKPVPAGDFMQIDPDNGRPATEKTDVRVVFDGSALYLGVTCLDSEPDRWIGWQMRRDDRLFADDQFTWTIDTFLDGRTGYFFEMNPSGLMADALMGLNGDNREWNGIWNARVHRSEIGWTIEIEIPFRTLNFNPTHDTWGINFQRVVRRKNEQSIWNGWSRNQGVRRMSNAGLLTGIRNVTQGHGLDIKPYGLVSSLSSPGRGRPDVTTDASAGLDLFYNPTPLLRANFTVNTDFAQTEVDQRQVNLTRYSLFFPEQRDFFLDGATFFDFASESRQENFFGFGRADDERIIPFFSRRIGLSADATPQKIDYGTKLTGQAGAEDVGLLHVRTGQDNGFASEDFTVARVKRRLLRQSYVGGLYTRRDARVPGALRPAQDVPSVSRDAGAAHTAGVDALLATSTFLGDQNLEASGWFLRNSDPGVSDGGSAFGAMVRYPNDLWNAKVDAIEVQEQFNPAMGFVSRTRYRQYNQTVEYGPRPRNHPFLRQVTVGAGLDTQTDLQNRLLKRNFEAQPLRMEFHSQDNFRVSVARRYERLDTPFAIAPGITLPVGAEYTFNRMRLFVSTANRRAISVNSAIELGEFYSGHRRENQVNLNLRVRPGLFFFLTGQWNVVQLPEGHFTTRLFRFVGETHLSPFIGLTNNVQYDTQSRVVGWQSRFRWILTPGNDLYVVYTHNWRDDPLLDRMATLDKRLASKVLYTYRF